MASQINWEAIEQYYEAPLKKVLLDHLNRFGNMAEAGRVIGQEVFKKPISYNTVFTKCNELSIGKRFEYVDTGAVLETDRAAG